MDITPESKFTPDPRLQVRVLDGEAVILNTETGAYFGANKVGTHIWELYAAGKSLSEVIEGVLERFQVEPDVAEKDVYAYTEQLVEAGLLSG